MLQESARRRGVALGTAQSVNRTAVTVERPIQVLPPPGYLDVDLAHTQFLSDEDSEFAHQLPMCRKLSE
jgi:hypothetical protein